MNYDFMTLSSEDFEALVADLLSREWGTQLEVFKSGKDGGIDLRNSRVPTDAPTTIVQCRRYAPHKFAALRQSLELELPKIERLRPERYVLTTSVPLSDANKKVLLLALHPWCAGPEDIYGNSELNALLRKHPDVLRAHFKLWMSGTAVLEQILHARIFSITDTTVDAVKRELSRLVMHGGFHRALKIMEEHHHCVIVGNPGIGKSTIGRMLLCHYLRNGYTPIVVLGDISDAWKLINGDGTGSSRFVVFYDDFLGTFRFDEAKFAKNEDTSLMRFVEKARSSPVLRFVLTTREMIFADARRLHGVFERQADELKKCTILLEDYARSNRARVLYNHLYFSDLPDSRLQKFVSRHVYRDIVQHKHFNPRTVEGICRRANSASLSDDEFCDYVRRRFDDPSELWEHPFENQISSVARQLLVVLWSFGGEAALNILQDALVSFSGERDVKELSLKVRSALKELTGNFIACKGYENAIASKEGVSYLTFHNPSVSEFVERFVSRDTAWSDSLAGSVTHFRQLDRLQRWASESTRTCQDRKIISASFFSLLHRRAGAAEKQQSGGIHIFVGSPEPKFLESELTNDVQRTHVCLKIAHAANSLDSWASELWTRVTTVEGWTSLLTEALSYESCARSTKDLVDWMLTNVHEKRQELSDAFRACYDVLFAERKPWEAGPKALDYLDYCFSALGGERSKTYVRSLSRHAARAAEIALQSEKSSYLLEGQSEALDSMAARGAQFSPRLIANVRRRIINLRTQEESSAKKAPVSSTADSYAPDAKDTNFSLDSLFETLLER